MTELDVVTDDGVRLRTRTDGDPDAVPLLLLNSLGTDLSMWDPQIPAWSQTHLVVRYDQRGHGASEAPPPPYSVERLGQDALEVLDAHDGHRADVCGLSLGGLVALWIAGRAPDRVRRLVLADTAARVGTEEAWRTRAATVRAGGMDAIAGMVLERFFSPAFRASGHPAVGQVEGVLRASSTDGYSGACEALATADLRELAPKVAVPTLVLVGTADEATPPAVARELHGLLPDARLEELPGAGHLASIEQPERFGRVVSDFLADRR